MPGDPRTLPSALISVHPQRPSTPPKLQHLSSLVHIETASINLIGGVTVVQSVSGVLLAVC